MAKNNNELLAKVEQKQNGGGKPLSVVEQVGAYLSNDKVKKEIALALPRHITADRLSRVALTTIKNTPTLLECSVASLMSAVMQSAQLGLEPGVLGHVYFVPFFNKNKGCKEVQFILGYKGLIELARRSKEIISISASEIYSNDTFEYKKGFEETLNHIPNFLDRGELIGFYAYAITKDGGRIAEVMTKADVEKIRNRSQAARSGFSPWSTDYEMMGRKTVIKRLCKYLPLSIEVQEKIQFDEDKEFKDATSIELNLGEQKLATSIDWTQAKQEAEQIEKVQASEENDGINDGVAE